MDSSALQLTEIERLLLMAAAVQQHGPESDIDHANTAAIVLQVLEWSRPDYDDIRRRWKQGDWPSEVDEVYEPLARMTQMELRTGGYRPAERPGPALFEGSGNWGVPGDPEHPPSDPRFNSCRLTAFGQRVANELLATHPEYQDSGQRDAGEEGGLTVAVTKYFYDGDTVFQEYDGAGNTLAEYTSTGQGYGDLLSVYDGTAERYYEPDALGSTDALTDQSQAVADRWRYRAFGSATQTVGADATPFTWVGRHGYYADTETGLYQLGNGTRYYDPGVAQFLSTDPIGFGGGDRNLYRYAANNPINVLDPSGMKCEVNLHYRRWRSLGFRHFGLTIKTDVPGLPTEFYLDSGPIDGPGPGLVSLTELQFTYVAPIDDRYTEDIGFAADDSTCACLWNYAITFNNKKITYEPRCRNSNWGLRCMLTNCGLGIDWGNNPPVGWNCRECAEWGCDPEVYCVRWEDARCPK